MTVNINRTGMPKIKTGILWTAIGTVLEASGKVQAATLYSSLSVQYIYVYVQAYY